MEAGVAVATNDQQGITDYLGCPRLHAAVGDTFTP